MTERSQTFRKARAMNSNRRQASGFRAIIVVVLIMSLLVTVQAVAAAFVLPTAPVNVGPYAVTLQSVAFNGDMTSDWTYRVVVGTAQQYAVSHTSLGLVDADCQVVGSSDVVGLTVEDPAFENGHPVVKWEVTSGEGIKDSGESYTFTLRLVGAMDDSISDEGTYVAVKDGSGFNEGYVAGAICGTTAVALTSVEAQSGSQSPLLVIFLALGATVATAGILRKTGRSQ